MSLNPFKNGNRRITKLILFEMGAGVVIMVIGQVLGTLPSQDWMTPRTIKIACFILGTIQVTIKGCEMFFNKSVALYKSEHLENETTETETETNTNEITKA